MKKLIFCLAVVLSGCGRHGFDMAFENTIKHEGGYCLDASDSGGETKYGISKRQYPNINIKKLSITQARQIYYRDYWSQMQLDLVNNQYVAAKLFDISVNFGVSMAKTIAKRALASVFQTSHAFDKMCWVEVLSMLNRSGPGLLVALRAESAAAYRYIAKKDAKKQRFLKGWLRRAYA